MTREEIAATLNEIAELLELAGENPFRARSYTAAAQALERYQGELSAATTREELERVRGIGPAISQKILEMLQTGASHYLEDLRSNVPGGIRELMRVPGLSVKRARVLMRELGIHDLAALEAACREDRLAALRGFGGKTQERILAGIERLRRYAGRLIQPEAEILARGFAGDLERRLAAPVVLAGPLRRLMETVETLVLVVRTDDAEAAFAAARELPGVEDPSAAVPEGGQLRLRLSNGLGLDIRPAPGGDLGTVLALATGSEAHLAELAARARGRGLELGPAGLSRDGARLAFPDEESFYRELQLAVPPPELREGRGEVEAAARGELPRLVETADLGGLLHVHTDWSDGRAPLEAMVRAAAERGFAYVGISDHSRSAGYAGGLDVERVRRQREAIDALNAGGAPIPVLAGIESDILADGSLDYPAEVLAAFDFVIASIHSRFGMGRDEMTWRVLAAVSTPYTCILAHPTGRLLLEREPYDLDLEAVIDACAREGVAVEINANPLRLDLDWRRVRGAREAGAMIAVNPDAHTTDGIDQLRFGVGVARKGWLGAADVLNTRTLDEARAFFAARRRRGGAA